VVPDPLQSNQTSGRVIRFGPRKSGLRVIREGKSFSGNTDLDNSPVPDFSRYQSGESSEEYRHRMIVNAVYFSAAGVPPERVLRPGCIQICGIPVSLCVPFREEPLQ
jgi:hypothetical protein